MYIYKDDLKKQVSQPKHEDKYMKYKENKIKITGNRNNPNM